jgi:CHAT domain-containing protein
LALICCLSSLVACKRPSFGKLYNDACSRLDHGDLAGALSEVESARQRADPIWDWKLRIVQADILLWEGKPKESVALLDSALPASLSSGEFAVRTKVTLARALYRLYQPSPDVLLNPDSLLNDAEKLAQASSPELEGEIALARGSVEHSQQHYASAERQFRRALEMARYYHQPILEAEALGSLSRLFTAMGYYDQATDWGNASLEQSQSLHARHIETITRINLGWTMLELGDFDNARSLFEKAESAAADSSLIFAQQAALNDLGKIDLNQEKYPTAKNYFRRALAILNQLRREADSAVCLNNLALVTLLMGQLDEAEKYNQEALRIQREIGDRQEELRSTVTTAVIAVQKQEFEKAVRLLRPIITARDTLASVRWEAQDQLAETYIAMGQTAQAREQFKKALDTLDRSWTSINEEEHKLAFSSWAARFYAIYIRFLTGQGDYVKALEAAESVRAHVLEQKLDSQKAHNSTTLQVPLAQAYLRSHREMVLSYWLAPDKSYLWAITPSQVRLFLLPGKDQIAEKIARYQDRLTHWKVTESQPDSDGQDLYRMLVEPAQELIRPGTHVVVIPDGPLGKLNFETLQVPAQAPDQSPHFWIRDVEVEEASSIASLINSKSNQNQQKKLLLMGNPIQAAPDYPALKYAGEEIDRIANDFPARNVKRIVGPQAQASSYAASRPQQFDLIHFATHGIASDARPLDSAIILSSEKDASFKLYARDIIKTRINAEVVTISACYGAGSRTYSGTGLVGLAWAFLRAGAHRVVAGLWDVDDRSTQELMDAFYENLQKRDSPAKALRSAKLKMLDSGTAYRLPYYWAALKLYVGS